MSAVPATAVDEILALLKTAWDTTNYTMLWPNVEGHKPTTKTPWARVEVNHVAGEQKAIGSTTYENIGFLIVQIFLPLGVGTNEGLTLSRTVMNAYRNVSTASQVWFRNPRFQDIGETDDGWYQFNVIVDFTYTEVK